MAVYYLFTIQNCKNEKKSTAELGHSDLFSVCKSSFAQMPISQENMNVFWSDSITMVAEYNHFMLMQIDNPRWLPGAVTKNSINTKITILENHWLKLIHLSASMFLYEPFSNFCNLAFQDGRHLPGSTIYQNNRNNYRNTGITDDLPK